MSDIYQRAFIADADGRPIENGSLYVGIENGDPETDPITVYWDKGLTTPASQPIMISGGYVWNAGARADVYTGSTAYSLRIRDRLGLQVDYVASTTSIYSPGGASAVGTSDGTLQANLNSRVAIVATRTAMKALNVTRYSVCYLTENGREGIFELVAGSTPTDAQEGLYVASDTASYYWARRWDGVNGKPEWFGAVTNDSGSASTNDVALPACVALCPVTLLAAADYYVSDTWKVQTQYRTVQGGVQADGYDTGHGTRIICTNASASVFQVGPDASPGGLSSYYRNIICRDFACLHSVSLTGPASEIDATKTIVAQYLLDCEFERVYTWESLVGFFMYGCVGTYFRKCKGFRSAAQSGTDFYKAFWARGVTPVAAGGNPSLYLVDCKVEMGITSITRVGLYADGEAADLFVDRMEGSNLTNGILYAGSGSGNYGKQDIHFRNCVFDQCAGAAFKVTGLNAAATITIQGGYYQANATATAVIHLNGGAGVITLGGGMEILCSAAGSTQGVYVNSQPNVTIDETVTILDCPYGITVDGTSSGGRITCTINNPIIGDGTKQAVFMTAQEMWHVAPRIIGLAGGWAQGINLNGSANDKITMDPTRVDAAACSGSVKTTVNGNDNLAPGYYNSDGTAGSSGAGILVTGVTA